MRGDIPFGEYHDGMCNSRLSKHINLFQNCQFFILCDGCQEKMVREKIVRNIDDRFACKRIFLRKFL
jgi:hypothetical protein